MRRVREAMKVASIVFIVLGRPEIKIRGGGKAEFHVKQVSRDAGSGRLFPTWQLMSKAFPERRRDHGAPTLRGFTAREARVTSVFSPARSSKGLAANRRPVDISSCVITRSAGWNDSVKRWESLGGALIENLR